MYQTLFWPNMIGFFEGQSGYHIFQKVTLLLNMLLLLYERTNSIVFVELSVSSFKIPGYQRRQPLIP